jgi:hypothetical protein
MKLTALLATLTFALPLSIDLRAQEEMPQPGPEHKKLEAGVGNWDCLCEMMGPDGQPQVSKAQSKAKMAPGGFWLLDTFTGEFMGMKFTGFGATGYDPMKRKYIGTWMDSMSPFLMVSEGDYDASGKVLTMKGMAPGMDGQMAMHRMVTTHKDANTNVFDMYVTGADGKEMKTMTITYTRRGKSDEDKGEKKGHDKDGEHDGGKKGKDEKKKN